MVIGLNCPFCGNEETKVTDKRLADDGRNRRRRECTKCGKRFTTYEKPEGLLAKVIKRDGSMADFEREKIASAIWAAAQAVGGQDKETSEHLADNVVEKLEEKFGGVTIPTVEQVQDIVEKTLVEGGHYKTAKAYILYREQHKKLRETKSVMVDVVNTIGEYLDQSDWRVKENSNEAFSFSGLLLHTAGKVMSYYNLNQMYTPDIAEAHKKGYFHIHDLSHGVIGYCCGHSLKNLLIMGFGGVRNKTECKPAKHLSTVVHQMVNYIGCLQMEFAGAQAFSSVDTLLAPFVRADSLSFKEVKQAMQQLVFSLNIPSRWGSQYPFSNITFDWAPPEDMKKQKAIVGGKEMPYTYGELQPEMDMINKAFLEVMLEGDAKGGVFTFPIPTYNLTKDFDWDSENAKLLFELTAKYGLPYFQNYINTGLDPRSIRAMCCRLNINQKELMSRPGGMWGPGDSTGSIGVVTLNVNRLAYEACKAAEEIKTDDLPAKVREEYFSRLGYYMTLAKNSLETKREVVEKNLANGLMPYTKRYLGTFRNHFSTIGLCGMNEACINMLGKDIASSEGKRLAIDTLMFMRNMCLQFQNETGSLYNLEATPAESTAYRFARLDKHMHPEIITSGAVESYLTNSTQLPVGYTDDAITAIEHQNDIQPLYTGGTMFHLFVGERITDREACKKLVRKVAENTRLPYFSITPTFSVCPEHGYVKGEHFNCPVELGEAADSGRHETRIQEKSVTCGKNCEVYSRIVGYFRPVQNWNAGKQEEFKERLEFSEAKTLANETKLEKPIECKMP